MGCISGSIEIILVRFALLSGVEVGMGNDKKLRYSQINYTSNFNFQIHLAALFQCGKMIMSFSAKLIDYIRKLISEIRNLKIQFLRNFVHIIPQFNFKSI